MRRHYILYLCLLLLLVIPATTAAASLGEGNVTLDSSGNFTITPVNSSQPYIASNVSVLGALQAGSEAGGFNYTVTDSLPAEQGYLAVASIGGIENGMMNNTEMNWTYLINGEQFTAGVAQKRVSDGDNVTFVYGGANDTQMEPEYTLKIFVGVTGNMTGNQTMGNATGNMTGNQTMGNATGNMTGNQTMGNATGNMTGNQTMGNATGNMTGNQTMGNATGNMTGNQTMGNATGNMTLVDMINQDGNLTILAQAINATNLTETLNTSGPYTVFAPDDAAFEALGNETLDQLLNNTDQLTAILQYHVVEGNYTSEQLLNMTQNQTANMTQNQTANMTQNQTANMTQNQTANMTQNQTANMTQNQTANMTQNQTANMTQNQTANMTQTMTQAQNMTALRTLLGENLTVSLNQTTNQLMVNNASIIQPDINASNGVIHVIDQVLIPPNMTIGNMTAGNQTMGNATGNMTGNQTGNQTMGNVTGNQTMGNVTGNQTGNQTMGNATGNMTGNQTMGNVTGNMTGNQTMGNATGNMTGNQTMGNVTGMPNVTITMPENGSTVSVGNVTVEVNVTNFTVVEKLGQAAVPGEGHIHYYMDTAIPTEQGKPAIPENGSYAVSTNTSYTWENVTAGMHNFSVQLVNNNHTPLNPPVTAMVNVTAGNQTGNMTGNQTGNMTGNQTGNMTGNQTGNMTGNQTGNMTGNQTGNMTGNQTGNMTGNQTGNMTGNQTGNMTGNQTGGNVTTMQLPALQGMELHLDPDRTF